MPHSNILETIKSAASSSLSDSKSLLSNMEHEIKNNASKWLKELWDELEKKYTLSKKNFEYYFKNIEFHQIIGICYLVAAIHWLMQLDCYEKIIRSSVRIDGDTFFVKMPLWEPWATEYKVWPEITKWMQYKWAYHFDDLISDDSGDINSYWITALIHAFGQHTIWEEEFDYWRLNALYSSNTEEFMQAFLWQENADIEFFGNGWNLLGNIKMLTTDIGGNFINKLYK